MYAIYFNEWTNWWFGCVNFDANEKKKMETILMDSYRK